MTRASRFRRSSTSRVKAGWDRHELRAHLRGGRVQHEPCVVERNQFPALRPQLEIEALRRDVLDPGVGRALADPAFLILEEPDVALNDRDEIPAPAIEFHLLVRPLDRLGRMQLGAVLAGEGHLGQDVMLTLVHQLRQPGPARAELVGGATPGLCSLAAVGLVEGLADRSGDHGVLAA